MNILTQRLLLFFLGTPLLIGIILFLPMYNHLAWNIVMILGSIAGASELFHIFSKYFSTSLRKLPFAGAFIPVSVYLEMSNYVFLGFTAFIMVIITGIIMTREIFLKTDEDINNVNIRLLSSVIIFFYPGLFMAYTIKISFLPNASYLILLFLLLSFTNDSLAFVGGSLFGGKSRKIFLVSPNKSLAGFISGTLSTIAVGLIFRLIINLSISAWEMLILSTAISISANTGDLIESAIKRSAKVKDSGRLMPGRGGILDSIDSILFSAPVFYYILTLAFKQV